jgi:hypothetical protein
LVGATTIFSALENDMDQENLDFRRMDLHRRIALVLRKEPGLLRHFAERLRSKLATAKSATAVSENEWEWYVILTLCSPLQVIKLLEDSSERAVRLRQNSPFVSLLSIPKRLGTMPDPDSI